MERVRLSFDYSQLNATISYLTTARGIIVKYIMIAKPMKNFELLFSMIQFLINSFIILRIKLLVTKDTVAYGNL